MKAKTVPLLPLNAEMMLALLLPADVVSPWKELSKFAWPVPIATCVTSPAPSPPRHSLPHSWTPLANAIVAPSVPGKL